MKDENGIIIEDTLSEEDLDKVLLHCSWLLRKLCQPSAYSSIRDKVRQHALCASQSCLISEQPMVASDIRCVNMHCVVPRAV